MLQTHDTKSSPVVPRGLCFVNDRILKDSMISTLLPCSYFLNFPWRGGFPRWLWSG